jgi:FkbM family methyltransferase
MALADVSLAGGMVVSCLQKHEVPILNLEVQGYFDKHLELRPGDTVFDVGANIGLFSLAVYERCQQDVRLYAFEPVKAIFDVLRANLARHGTGDQLRIFQLGLSSHSEDTTFVYYPGAPNLSSAYPVDSDDVSIMREAVLNNIMHLAEAPLAVRCLRLVPSALRARVVQYALKRALSPKQVVCRMQTLSRFVREHAIERIDLLKIDAEKAELEIFRGIGAQDWPKIQQVVVEVHDLDDRLETIVAKLREHGLTEITVDQPPTLTNSNIYNVFATRGRIARG